MPLEHILNSQEYYITLSFLNYNSLTENLHIQNKMSNFTTK